MIWTIPLMFTTPPLTANQRKHWTYRARITRELHEQVIWQVRAKRVPALHKPAVTLHYQPADRRRRDVDNLVPTSKACVDAVVKAGVISDDSSRLVDHRMPVIHDAGKPARLWLEISDEG